MWEQWGFRRHDDGEGQSRDDAFVYRWAPYDEGWNVVGSGGTLLGRPLLLFFSKADPRGGVDECFGFD